MTSFLISVASFDILPLDYINNLLFKFEGGEEEHAEEEEEEEEEDHYETEARFNEVGMESSNFISNSGTLLWVLFGWVFAVFVHLS